MAEKKGVTAKKKSASKKKVSKGESLACDVCGLSVVVEEVGGITVSEATTLLCCGKPMKKKASKVKVAKK